MKTEPMSEPSPTTAAASPPVVRPIPCRRPDSFLMGDLKAAKTDLLGLLAGAPLEYGPLVKMRFGPISFRLVTSPDYLHRIFHANYRNYRKETGATQVLGKHHRATLATAHGDEWLKRRRLMQPSFNRNQVDRFAPIMVQEAHIVAERWKQAAATGETIAVAQEMKDLTMRVIGRCMFSIDRHQDFKDLYAAYGTLADFIIKRGVSAFKPPMFIPTKRNRAFKAADRVISETLRSMISARVREETPRDDLLESLLAARSEDDGQGLAQEQIIAEMSILVFAGHETTATTITWLFHILAEHPEIEARVHDELEAVLGGRLPTATDLPKLEYTTRVIMEAIRLYPAAYLTLREAIDEDMLGPYRIDPKAKLLLNIYGLHRHPDYWETPDRFNPAHFEDAQVKTRPKLAFLPFGAGPRKCIGEPLAMMEIQIVLAILAQRFRLRLVPGHQVVPEAGFALQPRGGLPMKAEPRT